MNLKDNQLINNPLRASTKSSGSPASTSHDFSYTSILGSALTLTLVSTIFFTHNKLFIWFIKAYLEAQTQPLALVPAPPPFLYQIKPCEQLFKARFLTLYFGNLDTDCYNFCQ